ncbi:AMP-binding protein [Tsukamurella sp. PLM1]|uniref:AMP-binding protein n=1 Tax=Tsukamurella sp. PLM1 TaxID=2929795 RepID=UPI00205182A2|nr:AMP-binding protein [Tsukamurella sp. PLM1]BDH56389.1 hypothetical protein MTP03_13280 [Tsukamurella sp. PLM1]
MTRGLPKLARLGQLQAHTQVSLGKLLAEQAARDPHGELFLYEDRVHSKHAVNERIDRVVSGLLQVGVRQGEHVGVLMHTRPSALVVMAALSRLGAVAVLLPPGIDYAAALRLGEATSVITDPEHAQDAVAVAERVFVVGGGDRRDRPGASRQDLDAELVDLEQVDPDDVRIPRWYRPDAGLGRDLAFVMFSEAGGGLRAKRVTNGRWALSAFGTASAARLSESDTVYCLTPLSHSSGLMTSLGGALAGGSRIALTRDFDPDRFMVEVQRYGVTVVCYTWNLMRAVLDAPDLTVPKYHPVRAFIGSGMSAELSRRVSEAFDAQVVEFYASTEGEIVLAKVRGGKPGAKGRRLPGSAEVALVDYYFDSGRFVENGDGFLQEVRQGEVGVLLGRADPDTTHHDVLLRGVFRPGDAWFSTGHLFRQDDDGDYWLVDDVRTVAVTDRGPVYSIPVSDVLEQLGQVDQAVVYHVPGASPSDAPQVVAAVTLRAGDTLTADEVTDAFAGRHEQYPDAVHVVDSVPQTSWFRPRRGALAERGTPGPGSWRFDAERSRYA